MSLLLDRLNFLARKNVGTFSEAMASPPTKTATGKMPIASAGSTTRSCAPPMA
jgi:hypothetical protein